MKNPQDAVKTSWKPTRIEGCSRGTENCLWGIVCVRRVFLCPFKPISQHSFSLSCHEWIQGYCSSHILPDVPSHRLRSNLDYQSPWVRPPASSSRHSTRLLISILRSDPLKLRTNCTTFWPSTRLGGRTNRHRHPTHQRSCLQPNPIRGHAPKGASQAKIASAANI